MKAAYQLTIDDLVKLYKTDLKKGLTQQEVSFRLKRDGPNELPSRSESLFMLFLKQFQSPLIYLLFFAAALIFFVGQHFDAYITSGILLFNALISTIQEGRAHATLESLRRYSADECVVMRDGERHIILTKNLVIGDLIIVKEGDKVPADARIIDAYNLLVNEAMLTGEVEAVSKSSITIEKELPVAEQHNMLFLGTYIYAGIGHAMVVATACNTQIGQLKTLVESIESTLPLKKKIQTLTRWLVVFIGIQTILFLCIGLLWGKPLKELAVFLAALFICVVPEGLPVILTLALVAGVRRMAQHSLLVKRLQAVEGLAFTNIILIDKTGTLTRNELYVSTFFANESFFTVTGEGYFPQGNIMSNTIQENEEILKKIGNACRVLGNYADISYDKRTGVFKIKGDPTDAAFLVLSKKIEKNYGLNQEWQELVPSIFNRRYHIKSGLYSDNNQTIALIIGSPETVFARCKSLSNKTHEALKTFLMKGLRIIALAYKENVLLEEFEQSIEHDLTFLALFALQDTIRPEAAYMVEQVRKAGLKVVMATGDHKNTALFIAKAVGIFKEQDEALDGNEIMRMSEQELLEQLPHVTVFSRVSPEKKLKIVRLYQQEENNVAMTGDGVNDAPALVAANIGIAMGQMGTEVAKQAADMVLLNDSFATVVQAIKEGRNIFFSLRRIILYFFVTNASELLIVFFALCLNWPLPLFAAQILLLNFITDGLLNVALIAEEHDPEVLTYKITSQEELINVAMVYKIIWMALPMSGVSLGVFYWYYKSDLYQARTMLLVTLSMFQWFNAWNCRSEKKSLFQMTILSNTWLLIACCIVLCLLYAVIYVPILQEIFHTVPLSIRQWLFIIAITAPILALEEIRKFIFINY